MEYIQKRFISLNFKKKLLFGFILLYMVMSFFALSVENKLPSYITFTIALFISVMSLTERINTTKLIVLIISFGLLLSMVLFSNRNSEPIALIVNAFFFLVSYLISYLIFKLNLSKKVAIVAFIISHGYFILYCLYRYKLDGYIDENTFNSMFYLSSRNIVSAILLTTTVFVFSVLYIKDNKIFLSLLFLDLICSLLLYGRSGVILSFGLFILGFYLKYIKGNTVNLLLYSCLFLISMIVVMAINIESLGLLYNDLITKTNLQSGLDTPRLTMWYDYITHFNLNILLKGTAFEFSPLISSFEGNPHNSYIMFQSRFGIIGFIFVFWIFGQWLRTVFQSPILGGLLLLVLTRMFLDSYALFSYFDFIWMYMLLFLKNDGARQGDENVNINNNSSF